jgi:hypothetical protein
MFKSVLEGGWKIHRIARDSDPDAIPGGILVGLVLIAE